VWEISGVAILLRLLLAIVFLAILLLLLLLLLLLPLRRVRLGRLQAGKEGLPEQRPLRGRRGALGGA